jgi:hypothetical protein
MRYAAGRRTLATTILVTIEYHSLRPKLYIGPSFMASSRPDATAAPKQTQPSESHPPVDRFATTLALHTGYSLFPLFLGVRGK